MKKNCLTKKLVTSFKPKLICQFVRIHMNFFWFFSNFRQSRLSRNLWVVFTNRFNRLPRNFLNVVRNLFAKTYPNFLYWSFFQKKKSNIRRKIWKNSYVFELINESIWGKKVRLPVFLLNNFCTSIYKTFCNY